MKMSMWAKFQINGRYGSLVKSHRNVAPPMAYETVWVVDFRKKWANSSCLKCAHSMQVAYRQVHTSSVALDARMFIGMQIWCSVSQIDYECLCDKRACFFAVLSNETTKDAFFYIFVGLSIPYFSTPVRLKCQEH